MNKEEFVEKVTFLNNSNLIPAIRVNKFGVQETYNISPKAIRNIRIINEIVQFTYSQNGERAVANVPLSNINEVFDYSDFINGFE